MKRTNHDCGKFLVNLGRIVVVIVFCAAVPRTSVAQNVDLLYSEKCAGCHAADGSGHTSATTKMAVPDLRSNRVKQMSDDDLYAATAHGKGHKSYPHAFLHTGLTEQQIRHLISYIRKFATDQN